MDQGRDHLNRERIVTENDQPGLQSRFLKWLEDATDSRILAIPRFFGFLYGPIDDRLSLGDALRKSLRRRLPAHVGWVHAFGGTTYLLFLILVATGVLLSFYYRPSVVEAYPSLQYLESEVGPQTDNLVVRNPLLSGSPGLRDLGLPPPLGPVGLLGYHRRNRRPPRFPDDRGNRGGGVYRG